MIDRVAVGRQHVPDESWRDHTAAFELALDTIRRLTRALTGAIGALRYLDAWIQARELARALSRAEDSAAGVPEQAARAEAMRRLDDVRAVAASMLPLAPVPSSAATRQRGLPIAWVTEATGSAKNANGSRRGRLV